MTADANNDTTELATLVLALIDSRHSVAPRQLLAPGPSAAQLLQMVDAAACAPDHRALRPWRLIRIGDHQRDALADLIEACSRDRQPPPNAAELDKSRAKAYRAPTLLLAVLKTMPCEPEVPLTERAVTLGAALMSLLLAAHGLGFGAMLSSGRAVRTARFAQAMGLADDEKAVCFVSIGSAAAAGHGPRGVAADFLGDWAGGPPAPWPAR
jgi:nitroreductase